MGGSGKFPQKSLIEAGGVLHRPQDGFRVPRSILGGGRLLLASGSVRLGGGREVENTPWGEPVGVGEEQV